jgi:ERF superfamily
VNTTTRPTRMAPSPGVAQTHQAQLPQQIDPAALPNQRPVATVMAPAAPAAKAYPPKIAKAILTISRTIQPVDKEGINEFHKYAYPKWEDIRDELWPLVNNNGLIIIQNEISHEGVTADMIAITYDFTIINEDGDAWPDKPLITAICKTRDSKGILDDKAASKCRTQAEKNAMVQIFKIRTEDVYEVDQQGKVQPNARRIAPSPDGVFQPYELTIKDKEETAEMWAERFKGMLKHAKTPEDVDAWYAANQRIFNRLANEEAYKDIYQGLIVAMDTRAVELAPKQQVSQQQITATDGGFPGDTPIKSSAIDAGEIPPALRRTAPPPGISAKEQKFIDDLEAEYGSCNNIDELSSVQDSVMMPMRESVPAAIWKQAMAITSKHMQRVEGNG